jgi:hypothetical protein
MSMRKLVLAAAAAVGAGAIAVMGVLPAHAATDGTPLPAGAKSVEVHLSDASTKTTLAELEEILNSNVGQKLDPPSVAAVVTDPGKPLTDEEIAILATGKDVDGIHVLALVNQPSGGTTIGDLVDHRGSQQKVAVTIPIKKGPITASVTISADCSISSMSCSIEITIKATIKP